MFQLPDLGAPLDDAGCSLRRGAVTLALCGLILVLPRPSSAQRMPTLEPSPGVRVGSLAHEFSLKDLDGRRTYRLAELKGRSVVHVVFWATWCVPCIQEIPALREVYHRHRDAGLEILAIVVDINQTRDGVRSFARKHDVSYPILWDEGGRAMDLYGVSSIPRNFLIDRDGVIRYAGASLPPNYDALLGRLLGNPGATPAR